MMVRIGLTGNCCARTGVESAPAVSKAADLRTRLRRVFMVVFLQVTWTAFDTGPSLSMQQGESIIPAIRRGPAPPPPDAPGGDVRFARLPTS
jgi:hypothetical protein